MKPLLLVLLASTSLLACHKDDPINKVAAVVGQPFDLSPQQTATLPTSSTPIGVTLKTVNDSRCPSDGQCIWAGYVAVDVELTDAAPASQMARISLHVKNITGYATDSVRVTLNRRPYSLQLLDVTPYPTLANNGQGKVATLRLLAR